MQPFSASNKINASVQAQAIVYIRENNLLKTDVAVNNTTIADTIKDLKLTQDKTNAIFKERISTFEENKKYYCIEKRSIKKWGKYHYVFSVKEKLLELKNSSKAVSPEIRNLFSLLSESETRFGGKIVPMYNLWTRLLWFLPQNEVMYLYDKYEKRMKHLYKQKINTNKKEGCYGRCIVENKFMTKTTESPSAYAQRELEDLVDVTIFNDVQYLCDTILSKIEKEIMEYFPKIVVVEDEEEVVQKPKLPVLSEEEEEAEFEKKQSRISTIPVDFDDEDWN